MSVFADVFALSFEARGISQVLNNINQQAAAVNRLNAAYARVNTAQASGTVSQIRNAQNSLNNIVQAQKRAAVVSSATGAGVVAAAALGIVRAEIRAVEEAVQAYEGYARQIQTVRQLTGSTTRQAEQFSNLSAVAGVGDSGQIREVLALAKDIKGGAGAGALSQLGISTSGKNELEVLQQVIGKLSQMQDGVKKTSLELDLFKGKSVAALQPFLNLRADIAASALALNANLSGDALKSITDFQDNIRLLGQTFLVDFVFPIVQQVIPALDGGQQRLLHFWAIRVFRANLSSIGLFYPWPKTFLNSNQVSISKIDFEIGG